MTDNNIIPLNNNQSEALELIASGEYDLAVEKIAESPEAFDVLVSSIGKKLQEEKKSVEKIRDRNFFKRLFSSNIKDVASIVLSQNETMSHFFVMLQLTAMATKGNAKVLYRICDCLKRGTDAGELEDSSIRRMAISFMEDNIKALEEEKIRDEAIMKLLKAYAEFKQTTIDVEIKEHGIEQSITHLRSDVEEKIRRQEKKTNELFEKASASISNSQNETRKQIDNLRNHTDSITEKLKHESENAKLSLNNRIEKLQSSEVNERNKLQLNIQNGLNENVSGLRNNICDLQKEINNTKRYTKRVGIALLMIGIVLVCVTVIVLKLSLEKDGIV